MLNYQRVYGIYMEYIWNILRSQTRQEMHAVNDPAADTAANFMGAEAEKCPPKFGGKIWIWTWKCWVNILHEIAI